MKSGIDTGYRFPLIIIHFLLFNFYFDYCFFLANFYRLQLLPPSLMQPNPQQNLTQLQVHLLLLQPL